MIKVPVVLAAVIAAVPCNAQDVRVFNGGQEHVYGPGGQILDSPEHRAKNERARQMRNEQGATTLGRDPKRRRVGGTTTATNLQERVYSSSTSEC